MKYELDFFFIKLEQIYDLDHKFRKLTRMIYFNPKHD
jgi:hypothetical protein